jgi:histidinol-phosphate aminotransferase
MNPIASGPAVRAGIRDMEPYLLEARVARDKLDQNESPLDWPRDLKEQVLLRLLELPWNRYPDFELCRLRSALAAAYGLEAENVLAGNGSNELLLTALLTLAPGADVIVPSPSFALYEKMATIVGGRVVRVPLDPASGRIPVGEMAARARESRGALIVVCSPNNPTGGVLAQGELERLLESGATVLLDRAYGDFVPDVFPPLHPRLVVLSSFSKSYALAGLRIGWLAAAAPLCRELRKVRLPYSVNVVSEEIALAAIRSPGLRHRAVALVSAERGRVRSRLEEIGVEVFPSGANFLCFRTGGAGRLFARLRDRDVLVRDVGSYPRLEGCLRVSIGTQEENDRFLAAMGEVLA